MKLTAYIYFVLMNTVVFSAFAQEEIRLWQGQAPGALGNEEKDIPILIHYPAPAEKSNQTAVVICPGGGYNHLAMDHEGHQIAQWLNSMGISAFILKYRLGSSGYRHPVQINDGLRAIRMVRSKAKSLGYQPDKIGILGFSAGGHLAVTVGTLWTNGNLEATETLDRLSSRPDFMILLYPVISFAKPITHRGSRQALLGSMPDSRTVDSLSAELQVNSLTPPAFLIHTHEDSGVPSENSLFFYLALKENNVPAELHIYEKGRHGLGLGGEGTSYASWPQLCQAWLQDRGILLR